MSRGFNKKNQVETGCSVVSWVKRQDSKKVLQQRLEDLVSTTGCFSSAPTGRICATTPEQFSDRVTWRPVTVHVFNKPVDVAGKWWKIASECSCGHLMRSTWAVSENKRGNAAEHVLVYWKARCFAQICLFLFPSLQTSAVLPSLVIGTFAITNWAISFAADEAKRSSRN